MIGRLKGIIEDKGDSWVLVDVNGVCYEVEASTRLLSNLPAIGAPVVLFIETYVREDQLRLFGFSNEAERGWFKLLMGVQGVGAKVALAIQGVLSAGELSSAIVSQDKAMVSRAPGVGPKVAQRIVQELKDKVPALSHTNMAGFTNSDGQKQTASATDTLVVDAVSALENLGYARAQAHQVIMAAVQNNEEAVPKTADLIRLALKELGARG